MTSKICKAVVTFKCFRLASGVDDQMGTKSDCFSVSWYQSPINGKVCVSFRHIKNLFVDVYVCGRNVLFQQETRVAYLDPFGSVSFCRMRNKNFLPESGTGSNLFPGIFKFIYELPESSYKYIRSLTVGTSNTNQDQYQWCTSKICVRVTELWTSYGKMLILDPKWHQSEKSDPDQYHNGMGPQHSRKLLQDC